MKKRQLLILFVAVLALVGFLTFINRQKISSAVKTNRAERHLEQAVKAAENGRIEETIRLSAAALQLTPGDIRAMRLLLMSTSRKFSPQILNIAADFFYHPAATADDRARCLAIFLEYRDLRLFWANYSKLEQAEKIRPDNLYLLAGYHASRGNEVLALQALSKGPQDDPRFFTLRNTLNAISKDKTTRTNAQEELAKLIESSDAKISLRAFRQIEVIPIPLRDRSILEPAARNWVANQSPEDLNPADKLILPTFEWMGHSSDPSSEERKQIIEKVIENIGPNYPVIVCQWLLSLELGDEAYAFAREIETKATDDRRFEQLKQTRFEFCLRALELSARWDEQLKVIAEAPPGIPPVRLAIASAIANKQLGNTGESQRQWREAFNLAKSEVSLRNSYVDIYHWAIKYREIDIAVAAMIEACKNPKGILPSTPELSQLLVYLAEQGRDTDLINATNGLFVRETFSLALMNNAVYLRELSGNPAPESITISNHIIRRSPETIGFQTTLIISHLKRQQYAKALAVAERITTRHKVDELPAAEAIIIAGAYRKSGKKHFAAERDLQRKLDELMPIERRVFAPWFED